MEDRRPIFTVDWEPWFAGVLPPREWASLDQRVREPTLFLLDLLSKYKVRGVFFILGWLRENNFELYCEIRNRGHLVGNHSFWHQRGEGPDKEGGEGDFRSPYWSGGDFPGPCGGFFMRLLPYELWVQFVKKCGQVYVHPHDLDESHPKLKSPWLDWKRHVGLNTARWKLERLLKEVPFGDSHCDSLYSLRNAI